MTTVIQFPERAARPLTQVVSGEVRALMGRYNVNQTMLARWLGIQQSAVSARLKGDTRWTLNEIEDVATAFAVHPAELMGGYATGPRPDGGETLPILRGDALPTEPYLSSFLLAAAA